MTSTTKRRTPAKDIAVGMYWHPERGNWPHRITAVKAARVNVTITDEYGTKATFRLNGSIPTATIVGDIPA